MLMQVRDFCGDALHFSDLMESNMNIVLNHPERPSRNITWPVQAHPAHWDRQYETITHPAGAALKRCFKRESREAS
jgi:hypothetical protein